MIYDYLLTAFKLMVGLITTEILIYGALGALGFYLIWICFSLAGSFQKKFNRNCVKLYNFVKKNNFNANEVNSVDFKASKISSGFSHGWKRFKSASYGKPSDFITRRDALDVEVTGGVLNQGKTFMRAFINVFTFVLFLVNFAYLGNNNALTCYLISESLVLPLIFFAIAKILYFLYTSVKQQLYKADIECLYELLYLLDEKFAKNETPVQTVAHTFVQGEDEIATTEGEELELKPEEPVEEAEQSENNQPEESVEEVTEEESAASKYDFFKKKNIDVDKLVSEVPKTSSSLPFINVDSDYVIKDDEAPAVSKSITNLENGSALLGGMMQDMSSIKNKQKEEKVEEPAAESNEEIKVDAEPAESEETEAEEQKEEKTEDVKTEPEGEVNSANVFDSLDAFEVAENAETPIEEPKVEENKEEPEAEPVQEEVEEVKLEIPDVEPIEIQKPEPEPEEVEESVEDEISEEKKESIATVVGGFKAKSKLASGGVVIERNEPIARRNSYEPVHTESFEDDYDNGYVEEYPQKRGITQLSAESNTDNILNSFRSSAGGYEEYPSYSTGMQGGMYNQGYGAPQYNQGYGYPQAGYGQPVNTGYGVQGYQQAQPQGFNAYGSNVQNYNDNAYDEEVEEFEDYEDEEVEETVKSPTKKAVKRSKEDEPRPRNLRKKESEKKTAMAEEILKSKNRGRPKKQVFDETVTIKNDKEFDEVLSRAEKLMKKSESGLSASQSKRIEKELKMLMDAMNKYKEGV